MITRSRRTESAQRLAAGKGRRKFREALTGYLFVFPAAIITFLFGLWPVISGFYESIKSGSPLTNRYVGFDNYIRSLGSLNYITQFIVCLIFLYIAYRSWMNAYLYSREMGESPWYMVLPGLLAGAGLIILAFNLVTGSAAYTWLPVALFVLAFGGFYTADQLQQFDRDETRRDIGQVWLLALGIGMAWIVLPRLIPDSLGALGWIIPLISLGVLLYLLLPFLGRIQTWRYISAGITMGTLMLGSILLARYTVGQMEADVALSQRIAAQIFNQDVLDATVFVTEEDAVIEGAAPQDEIIVQVEVNGETIEAPLAPEAYSQLPVDTIQGLETALQNNQKVQVVLPDGSTAEGTLTGLPAGEHLAVPLTGDDLQAARPINIYSAMDVGENVIRAGGHTEPLWKQIDAALGVFLGIATMTLITIVRRRIDPENPPAGYRWLNWGRVLLGLMIVILFLYLLGAVQLNRQAAQGMAALSEDQFKLAYEFVTGARPQATLRAEVLAAQLLYWPQVFLTAVGALFIGVAYLVWRSAQQRDTKLGFGLTIFLAILLMVGGWLTISELPRTMSLAGREAEDTFNALIRTAMYSLGTVPVQLALGLFLAYLLFSEIDRGKSLFRVIYFMPYIAPSVATSTVFLVIFSLNKNSLANQGLRLLGMDPLLWLQEPNGIVRIFYQQVLGGDPLNIPGALQGPSLALFTVILYNIWVFAGYNTVVFMAGLGAIPPELYEAAEVDGAGRWARFRSITLPLLSPTTFFLSMLSIIGTFKAFAHIYVLREQAVGKEIDTMSIHIFNTLYASNDPGYAAALAFILFAVILILTLVQNRLAKEQVFYG
jgi:multiple sugar transport system permease protein